MRTRFIFFLSLLILAFACEKNETDDKQRSSDPLNIALPDKSEEVITASNTFGFDIFRLLLTDEESGKNLFISPTSISLALGMTLNGANSATEDSMVYALRLGDLANEQINATYRDLIDGLTSADEKVLLSIANSIWYRMGFTIQNSFLDVNSEFYNAEVAALDFNSPDAVSTINNWVADHTNDRIPTIIDEISPEQIMFLINAIYFKGIWTREFNPENTHNGSFYMEDGTEKTVSMMASGEEIGYFENELFEACELDYGRGNYSMVVLLPRHYISLETVCQQLNSENWDNWMSSFTKKEVTLTLPKFTFSYEKMLNSVLSTMGMGIAFDPNNADFTGINALGELYIGFVKHKTFVEVNEEGTEASAVTVVSIDVTSVDPSAPPTMCVDHPFIFAIREKTTRAIVFIGRVAEPKVEED